MIGPSGNQEPYRYSGPIYKPQEVTNKQLQFDMLEKYRYSMQVRDELLSVVRKLPSERLGVVGFRVKPTPVFVSFVVAFKVEPAQGFICVCGTGVS